MGVFDSISFTKIRWYFLYVKYVWKKSFLFNFQKKKEKKVFGMSNKYSGKFSKKIYWKKRMKEKGETCRKKWFVNKGFWDSEKRIKRRLWFGSMKIDSIKSRRMKWEDTSVMKKD